MPASLADIFHVYGPGGKAEEIKDGWDVHDRRADRMDIEVAQKIIAREREVDNSEIYNATEQSYAQGLQNNDRRLLGTRISTVEPYGSLKANVPAHGVGFFRL